MTRRPPLTIELILARADAWHARTGRWPLEGDDPEWKSIDSSLRHGWRGLPGGSSLARLLGEQRGARNPRTLKPYTERQILMWARSHYRKTGRWPNARSGAITEAPGEVWRRVDDALRHGLRGLRRGPSLAKFLGDKLGARTKAVLPPLTVEQILTWADAYHKRTGKWPHENKGLIPESPGETWKAVAVALAQGHRGLPGGDTLYRLLHRERMGGGDPKHQNGRPRKKN